MTLISITNRSKIIEFLPSFGQVAHDPTDHNGLSCIWCISCSLIGSSNVRKGLRAVAMYLDWEWSVAKSHKTIQGMKILTLRRSMQKIYISQNEKLSFVLNADQLQFVKFLFPWYAAKDGFCCEQISGIILYHCWESYSFQMLWLIHGWAMHREEIRNKICLIWLF